VSENTRKNVLFQDFLQDVINKQIWTTVGLVKGDNEEFIFSCMTKKEHQSEVLEKNTWELQMGQGKYKFIQIQDNTILNPGVLVEESFPVLPFTLYRHPEGKYSKSIEILQDFILYHDLRVDNNGNYVNPVDEDIVINFYNILNVEIKTNYLRDFLAATDNILIRYVKNYRRISGKFSDLLHLDRTDTKFVKDIKSKTQNFTININDLGNDQIESLLNGKDLVLPYSEPIHPDYLYLTEKDGPQYEEFITGIDDNGRQVWESSGPEYKLKLVFFRKEVLKNYYNNDNFEVQDGAIYKHNSWYIPYGINEKRLVHVWLKDLMSIPYSEQSYWKGFNVLPDGGMGKTFFSRQLDAKFAKSTDPIVNLLSVFIDFKTKFKEKFDFDLIRDLSLDDKYIEKQIHTLTVNQQWEFDQQILYLSKLIVDHLNIKEIESHIIWRPSKKEEEGSINYFENFLIEKAIYDKTASKLICKPLRNLQSLRSSGSAHAKSSDYQKNIKKLYNVDDFNYDLIFNTVVQDLTNTFESLLIAV